MTLLTVPCPSDLRSPVTLAIQLFELECSGIDPHDLNAVAEITADKLPAIALTHCPCPSGSGTYPAHDLELA
jgi:hypothetical protein